MILSSIVRTAILAVLCLTACPPGNNNTSSSTTTTMMPPSSAAVTINVDFKTGGAMSSFDVKLAWTISPKDASKLKGDPTAIGTSKSFDRTHSCTPFAGHCLITHSTALTDFFKLGEWDIDASIGDPANPTWRSNTCHVMLTGGTLTVNFDSVKLNCATGSQLP